MYFRKLFISCLFICACKLSSIAQPYYFSHLQVENGLSNNTVFCITQDDYGFLWFGTRDGLNKYDGYRFKTFRKDRNNAATLGHNSVHHVYKDRSGTLWIGTADGISRYDHTTDSFHFVAGSQGYIYGIEEDGDGNLWFISEYNLYKWNKRDPLARPVKIAGPDITSICFANQTIWAATTEGFLKEYNQQTNNFTNYSIVQYTKKVTSTWIEKLFATENGEILIGTTQQGVKSFDLTTHVVKSILTYNADNTGIFARNFLRYSPVEYWIATEDGIYIYNQQSNEVSLIQKHPGDPYSLSDNAVYTFCKDHEGGIWIGTYFAGINYYSARQSAFEKYYPRPGANGMKGNVVRGICADKKGNLWMGTEDGGLNRLSFKTGAITNFSPSGAATGISTDNIHGLLVKDNKLLLGTFLHGLDVMDLSTYQVTRNFNPRNNNSLLSNFIYYLYQTPAGKIYAATSYGVYQFDDEQGTFHLIKELPFIFYTSVFEDHAGILWCGTSRSGLYAFDRQTRKLTFYEYKQGIANSLTSNSINYLTEDTANNLWIATEFGLSKLSADRKQFRNFTKASGLPSNLVDALLEDAHGNMWISTSNGLACMNTRTEQFICFTRENGLLSDQFNYASAYKDDKGYFYFGSLKGLVRFFPDSIYSPHYPLRVYFTGFQVNNAELSIGGKNSPLRKSILLTDTLVLQHNESSFSIDFAAISYATPFKTSYAYKMEGLDNEWVSLSTNRKVYFTQLKPGKYIFRVKAALYAGAPEAQEASLVIVVKPHFLLSNFARFVYMVLAGGVLLLLMRQYSRMLQRKNKRKFAAFEAKKEKEIYQAKIAFFTEVAHEIKTPLTLIKGPVESIMETPEDIPYVQKKLKIIHRNTERLLELASQLLDFRKTEAHSFSLSFVKSNVISLVEHHIADFETAIESRRLHLTVNIEPEAVWAYIDREAFNKILSNLMNNAVKYAANRIQVKLPAGQGSHFSISIKNDGYLIPFELREKIFEPFFRAKEVDMYSGTGLGLSLARSLAKLHNGSLELRFDNDGFNTFVLTLPVHQETEFNLSS